MAFLVPLVQIVWVNILLSGDNAMVIALACRSLPVRQRRVAIWAGAGAAIALRVIFTLSVAQFLALPFFKIISGVVLLLIAIRLVDGEESAKETVLGHSLWASVRIIAVADVAMSLDNAVAIAAAAKGSAVLILTGLSLSIPLIVCGSTLALALIARFPTLIWAGAAMLGWVAGELIALDPDLAAWSVSWLPSLETWPLAASGAALTLGVAWLRQKARA